MKQNYYKGVVRFWHNDELVRTFLFSHFCRFLYAAQETVIAEFDKKKSSCTDRRGLPDNEFIQDNYIAHVND